MPSTNLSPKAALLAAIDWSGYAGTQVFTRSVAGAVSLDASVGPFDDLLDALNGYGSRQGTADQDIGQQLDAAWVAAGGTGNITMGIDADDRPWIECDGEGFTVTTSLQLPANVLGIPNGTAATGSGPWRATATSEWARAQFYFGLVRITGASSAAVAQATNEEWVQSVPTWLRRRDESDADGRTDLALTLEDADNDAGGVDTVRWGIDEDGHVWTSYEAATVGDISSWDDSSFRDALGFTGEESPVQNGTGFWKLTAANPADAVLALGRGLAQYDRGRLQSTSATLLTDGSMTGVTHLDAALWNVGFFVTGKASALDREAHYLHRFIPTICEGGGVTVYPDWPCEHRRYRDARTYLSTDPGYSLLYTMQAQGRRGRMRGSRQADGGGAVMEFERGLRHRSLQSLSLVERP